MRFLEGKGFGSPTPGGLLEFQRKAVADGREFELVDLVQEYISFKKGTLKSLTTRHSHIRRFFKRNRVGLPDDTFRVKGNSEPIQECMTVDVIRSLVSAADFGLKAFYLTLWMGLFDQERFIIFNSKYGHALGEHVKKGLDEPFLAEFPGRKNSLNRTMFYTFIGRDALSAWREYFERIRGYPGEGEAALLYNNGKPMRKAAIYQKHLRLLEKLHYIKRVKGGNARYGLNLHGFRDEGKTLLHLQGKRDGLDLECVDFWMGHVTDPNHYDKFYNDKEYTLSHYRIAEKSLNIISGAQLMPAQDTRKLVEQIIADPPVFKILRQALREDFGAKLVDIDEDH